MLDNEAIQVFKIIYQDPRRDLLGALLGPQHAIVGLGGVAAGPARRLRRAMTAIELAAASCCDLCRGICAWMDHLL